MKFYKKITINYISTGLVGLINILALSAYVRLFGLDSWGGISTYIAILNLVMMAELGIFQIYISEYAKAEDKIKIFRTYRQVIILFALAGITAVVLGVMFLELSGKFNNQAYKNLPIFLLAMGVAGLNLMNNFYYAHLIAKQNIISQNIRWVSFVFLKNIATIFVVMNISKEPVAYFATFFIMGVLEYFMNSILEKNKGRLNSINYLDLLGVIRKTSGLSLAIIIGLLTFNMDRLILPSLIIPAEFGVYATIVTIGLYFLQIQYPIIKTIFPILANKRKEKIKQSHVILLMTMLMASPLLVTVFFTREILLFYSVPVAILESATILFYGILISVYLNSIYNTMYLKFIIDGDVKYIQIINSVSLIFVLIMILNLGEKYPFHAGAISWVGVGLIQVHGSFWFSYIKTKDVR